MGQYWKLVNLDRKEYIDPHKLGCGLKLWEQLANHPSTGTALIILCAAMPEARGGGDLDENEIIGRWAGDRIAFVGDYGEKGDLENMYHAELIYHLCNELTDDEKKGWSDALAGDGDTPAAEFVLDLNNYYVDITDKVATVIERELNGKFEGEGWKQWQGNP